jgi:carbamoyltransferase
MNILGLNGRGDTQWSHDAAAAIVMDGRLVVALEQERICRRRHARGEGPWHAALACLAEAGIRFADVDAIAFGSHAADAKPESIISSDIYTSRDLSDLLLPPHMFSSTVQPIIHFVRHHYAHFASTLLTAGVPAAAGIVVDGHGEHESISIYLGTPTSIQRLAAFDVNASLGIMYDAAAYHCGLGHDSAGKLMGLAAFGRPTHKFGWAVDPITGAVIPPEFLRANGEGISDPWAVARAWEEYFSCYAYPYCQGSAADVMYYADLAASVQAELEQVAVQLAEWLQSQVGSVPLLLSGGVALNCGMNNRLAQAWDGQTFAFPAANDSGVAVGAALALDRILRPETPPKEQFSTTSLGRSFSSEECISAFREFGFLPTQLSPAELVQRTATDIVANRVVGWFQGRDEFGPRALGQRSLLANPCHRHNLNRLNGIKGRQTWRPVAPSVLAEEQSEVFASPVPSELGRFMLVACEISPKYASRIPAVVHVDGTTRPHLVHRDDNDGLFWNLISFFFKQTGVPLVCNTSFNLAGSPMVHTPTDAVKAFQECSDIDVLVINDLYLSRR